MEEKVLVNGIDLDDVNPMDIMAMVTQRDFIEIPTEFKNGTVNVIYGRAPQLTAEEPPVRTGEQTIDNGVIAEHDVAVKMRDGKTLMCDVLRPDTEEKVPCLLALSFSRQMTGVAEQGVPMGCHL